MKGLIATLALAGTALVASPAGAQEIQLRGPLAGAPAVSRLVRYREGRIALSPTFGITLQDEFSREMFFGARVEYNVTDWLAIGAWGAFAPVHIDTALTDQVASRSAGRTANVPTASAFPRQIGRRNWFADLHLSFIPLRGKFALFQNLVADIELFVFAGPAFIGVEERADSPAAGLPPSPAAGADAPARAAIQRDLDRNQLQRASRVAVTGTFGAGLNFYINRFLSVGIEYRAFPFAWNTSGTDENSVVNRCGAAGNEACTGYPDSIATAFERPSSNIRARINDADRIFHFNQMVNFSLTIFLPNAPRIGQ